MQEPTSSTVAAGKASTSGSVIRTDSLVREFGSRRVVNGVSLEVRSGEIVGLLGPNGAGKTTTFYMVVGLIPATSGRVLLDGHDLTPLRMHQRARMGLGYLPQEASVFRKLTVRQNLIAIAETLDLTRAEREERVDRHLEDLGLTSLSKQMAYTLSGGERRRLEISRALITSPKFLLLDEPFAAIDPISVAEVQRIVVGLRARGIGIIITDHNVRETLRIVDRAYLIHQGRVLVEGDSTFLINDAQARNLYLGENFNL